MHGQGLDGRETSGDPQEKCITCHGPSSLSIKRGLSALRWWEWRCLLRPPAERATSA